MMKLYYSKINPNIDNSYYRPSRKIKLCNHSKSAFLWVLGSSILMNVYASLVMPSKKSQSVIFPFLLALFCFVICLNQFDL